MHGHGGVDFEIEGWIKPGEFQINVNVWHQEICIKMSKWGRQISWMVLLFSILDVSFFFKTMVAHPHPFDPSHYCKGCPLQTVYPVANYSSCHLHRTKLFPIRLCKDMVLPSFLAHAPLSEHAPLLKCRPTEVNHNL